MPQIFQPPDTGSGEAARRVRRFAGYVVTSPPPIEAVTVLQVRDRVRQECDYQDQMISAQIMGCRQAVEGYLNRTIITTSYQQVLDDWTSCIRPVRPPLQSVESIQYVDTDGTTQTLGSTYYRIDDVTEPARITPERGVTYPTLRGVPAQVIVNFTAGYPTLAAALTGALTGTVTQVVADGIATPPAASGLLLLTNAAGQSETVSYFGYAVSGGVYTFNVAQDLSTEGIALTYVYAEDDIATIYQPPAAIQQAIIAMCVDLFEHPEYSPEISLNNNPSVKLLLSTYRLPEIGE